MFFWFGGASTVLPQRIEQTLYHRSRFTSRSQYIASGLPFGFPLEFARATNGYIYMASGVSPVIKWNGLTHQVASAGVIAPENAVVLTATGEGTITGNYQAYVRFVDDDGNFSNLSPVSNTLVADSNDRVTYSNLDVPQEDKSRRRQILRNTSGQLLTFYVDIDTTDIFSTSLVSTRTDDSLRNQEAQPLFDQNLSLQLANRYGVPPADKPLIAYYQNRLWLYGDIEYAVGSVQVTNGSTTVTGIGTQWTTGLEDRFLYVKDSDRAYLISSVDETAQTLTLDETWKGGTDKFAEYAIRSTVVVRNQLNYSEPGQFDAWPATQSLDVASSDDIDDQPTALISTQSFLYICQRRHTYRLSFLQDPIVDGGIFLSARRGCLNNRCWQNVDGFVFMLDDRGVYKFDGSDRVDDISNPIQDLFYFDRDEGELRINWDAARYFHCVHDRNDATLRWFVAFSGERLPRHALCFNYSTPQWWLEEYPWPVGDSTLLKFVNPLPVVAGPGGQCHAVGVGTLDQVLVQDGNTRGSVVSAGTRSITVDSALVLPVDNMVGSFVTIVSGRGKGASQRITVVNGQTICVLRPWKVEPDSTSVFQVGAIPWSWQGHWARWNQSEGEVTRRVTASFEPVLKENTFDMRIYRDRSKTPVEWTLTWPPTSAEGSGMTTTQGDADAVVDMTQEKGFSYLTLDSFKEYNRWRLDLVSLEMRGYSGEETVKIFEVNLEGAE